MSVFRRKRIDFAHHDIPTKANRILHFILIAMLLIIVRIWHLSFIEYDKRVEDSQKPQRRTVIEPAIRATIRDRFNIPLAINKMTYQATLHYSQIREIPSIAWEKDASGKKIKVYKRKVYIQDLAQLLSRELGLPADRTEDLIHAKASYYSQVPFVLKDDLTEKEYYRIKMLEKDWPGLHARSVSKRHYPQGRVAADVIGYMGAINHPEYEKILHEIKALQQSINEFESGGAVNDLIGVYSEEQARRRLRELEAKAYTLHDYIGKTGVEGFYEEQLRGYYGKKSYYTDSKGNYLRELPGTRPAVPGQRILLSISSELQEYAEQLLAQNEALRVVRKTKLGDIKQTIIALKQPWIKGGAIVVMDPITGELLALASYPRFDPNDFILCGSKEGQNEKKGRIHRWFENESYLAQLWNQQKPLERERYDDRKHQFYDETLWVTWDNYLNCILPDESLLRHAMSEIKTIAQAADIQRKIDQLRALFPNYDLYAVLNMLYVSPEHEPYKHNLKGTEKTELLTLVQENRPKIDALKIGLEAHFKSTPQNYDKVLLVDLCRLAVAEDRFSKPLLKVKGGETIENHHNQTSSFVTWHALVKEKVKVLFHEISFAEWRNNEEKVFLKSKRDEEKATKAYPKPYIDYLDQHERTLFQAFWESYAWDLLFTLLTGDKSSDYPQLLPYQEAIGKWRQAVFSEMETNAAHKTSFETLRTAIRGLPSALAIDYLKTLRPYDELNRPLLGKYRGLRKSKPPLEKHLAAAFYHPYGYGCGRSQAYRQSAIQGSLFKLVTAYEALVQRYQKLGKGATAAQLNPLVMTDQVYSQGGVQYVGYTEDGKPIPQLYKGGRVPRSLAHQHNGKVDLVRAIEVSSNPYFSLLAGECLEEPDDLAKAARLFSYGSRTGIDLPSEIAGRVPDDLATNRTGLYAMAIGQHSLVVTPLQTAVMLATLANGGKVLKPKVVKLTAGRLFPKGEEPFHAVATFPFQETLSIAGIDFPLFSALNRANQGSLVREMPTETVREIFLPQVIRQMLLGGLRAVSLRTHRESLASLTRLYRPYPEAITQFTALKNQILGKTSTSESVETIDLDLQDGTNIYTHVWFGSIAFEQPSSDKKPTALIFRDEFGQPELIVVVYLRYGGYGKEAAPLAAQIVKKWRELKEKYKLTID